ncbi:enoyl-CoA hydratase/isomerase family protein [Arvimicrobium flavum]|uniref:enoyl-CoA hydratase/isomerase family protein n=1 Tax=Arvimicrobium flavum TaxID=3393320 RepID=UPI00237BC59F|nr:enoyl-CoA hydratase/isomerase family protein [Mesorhizobium shangrilense]
MAVAPHLDLADAGNGLRIGRSGAVFVAIIDAPDTRNAISRLLAESLADALDTAADDGTLGAVVVSGTSSIFSSGGDFADMRARAAGDWREHFDHMARLTRRLAAFSKPTVAAVEGWAIGGGMALACCCDRVVVGSDARLVYGFDRIAVLPDVGLSHMLAARVGAARARRLMVMGETHDADEALAEGLVDRLVKAGSALEEAIGEAAAAARNAPLPIALLKSYTGLGLERALGFEKDCASRLFISADHTEGLTAFRGRRPAAFTGH